MKQRILLTGAHITPALALISEIRQKHPQWDVVIVGRKYALEGSTVPSFEYTESARLGIRFLSLTTGRLQRSFTLWTFISLLKLPIGFVQSLAIVLREKPRMIVSFGGYIALPIVFAGWLMGIPSVTHEQTFIPGLTNRLIALFVKKICVTHEETAVRFPRHKIVVTGLPIRKELWHEATGRFNFIDHKKYPILYMSGGSTGAVSLNNLVFPIVSRLARSFYVIHQTGGHSFLQARLVREALPAAQRQRYIIMPHVDVERLSYLLHHAYIVLGRCGANTAVELATFGRVAIAIPLPWSAGGEQLRNAQWLERQGGAIVMMQDQAAPEEILRVIQYVSTRYDYFRRRAKACMNRMPKDGAKRLLCVLEQLEEHLAEPSR